MPERDVGRHRFESDPQPGGVAEAAVGVGERVEQVVAGPDGDHLAGAGEDVHLEHGLVREPAAEAGRLDAETGDRATQRDGAQLWDHERDQPVREGRVDQVLVGAHALHLGDRRTFGRVGIDLDDPGQTTDVQARRGARGSRTEQVGGLLRQSHRITRRNGAIRVSEPFDGPHMFFPGTVCHALKLPRTDDIVVSEKPRIDATRCRRRWRTDLQSQKFPGFAAAAPGPCQYP
jgi:hypothetical protein